MQRPAAILGLSIALVFSRGAQSHALSEQECSEGGDFIRNAALSRDDGMSGTSFLGKFSDDLVLIKAFPPDLRWFVQDQADEDRGRDGEREECGRKSIHELAGDEEPD